MGKTPVPGPVMPVPVPPGRFAEYAACLAEGFCPRCRKPFRLATALAPGISWAACSGCGSVWEHGSSRACYVPYIRWSGQHGEFEWSVETVAGGHISGRTGFME